MGKLNQQKRTLQQHKILFGLLAKLNWIHLREDFALTYSSGRVSSTKALFQSECQELIGYLKDCVNEEITKRPKTKLQKMRSKFFYYCHELEWKRKNTGKLDYEHIGNWLIKYGYLHKKLNEYTEKQMYKLLQQIEKILDNKNAE